MGFAHASHSAQVSAGGPGCCWALLLSNGAPGAEEASMHNMRLPPVNTTCWGQHSKVMQGGSAAAGYSRRRRR
jgi:hypothetical protein